ncbi:hypothetical protein V1264_000155 [Littorina saxatilis]|uniref:CUB domain-containing protein n=1 Tax=Littorina saxatilis TaxID=31220 RepID=A0AAN9BYP8_9CAEN
MAGYWWFCLVVLVAPACVLGYTPRYKYLYDNCGNGPVTFPKDVILEFSSYRNSAPTNYNCQVKFQNSDNSKQVQVRFRYLDLLPSADCSIVGLALAEGSTYLTPPNGVCGTSKPSTNYRTKGNQVTVTLANRGSRSSYVDFELLLTSVYSAGNGSCRSNDFRCNNGLCISNQLVCNNYNDCGDDTDEVEGCTLATGVIVGIVFGVLVFVGFCTVFGVCVRRRRRTYIRVTEEAQDLLVDHLQTLRAQYDMLELEQELLKKAVRRLEKKTDWQENHTRRRNLLFFGLSRTATETHEDCARRVRTVMEKNMGVRTTVELERVQRLSSAVVLVRFVTVRDKMLVLSHAGNLRGTQVRVKEDFSQKVRDVRKGLAELRDSYRSEGKPAVMKFDKLYTEFDVFTYDLATKTVKKVDRLKSWRTHRPTLTLTSCDVGAGPSTCSTE